MNEDDEEEVEWFVVKDEQKEARFRQACYADVSSNDESLRKVTSVKEWDVILKDLRNRKAWAVGYKWFPYNRGGRLKGNDRELEVEAWFEQPDRGKGWYMVVHVHFETRWIQRKEGYAFQQVTAVNLRHTQNASNYWEKTCPTYQEYIAFSEEFDDVSVVAQGSEPEDSEPEGNEDRFVVAKSKKSLQSEKREAEAEQADRAFPVASFSSAWDRKDLRVETRVRGTHARDVGYVLDAALGDRELMYFDVDKYRKKRSAGKDVTFFYCN